MSNDLSVRSIAVCGDRIRYFRARRGLTQEQLACLSGYSDRLIRKAEASEKVSLVAIKDIANALSTDDEMVTLDELRSSPINVARQFLEYYDLYYDEMVSYASHMFAEDFRMHNAGAPDAPYCGIWIGRAGYQKWLQIMSSLVDRPIRGKMQVQYLTDGYHVHARYSDHFAAKGSAPVIMWINLYFFVQDGLVKSIHNEYDTFVASRLEAESLATRQTSVLREGM